VEVTTALTCDFAQVREGLLIVASGLVTRCWRPQVPAPLGLYLAFVVEMDQREAERPHEVGITVMAIDGQRVAEVQGGFQWSGTAAELEPGEKINLPVVLNLQTVGVPDYGPYDLRIYIDSEHRRQLTVWVKPPPAGMPGMPA
jgi:hypothetical protein